MKIPSPVTRTLPQVFVEDAPARPPPDRTSDFDLPGQREAAAAMAGPAAPAAAPVAPAPVAAAEGARADGAGEEAMPEWWSPGPRHRASGAYREQVDLRAGLSISIQGSAFGLGSFIQLPIHVWEFPRVSLTPGKHPVPLSMALLSDVLHAGEMLLTPICGMCEALSPSKTAVTQH